MNQKTIRNNIWLYEILKQWQDVGFFTVGFDYLQYLYCGKEKYKNADYFHKKIIKPAIEYINENLLKVDVDFINKDKKSKWVFRIK